MAPPARAAAAAARPGRARVRVLRASAQPGGDHAAVAALPGADAGADRDASRRPDRLPAAPARDPAAMADADRGVGAAARFVDVQLRGPYALWEHTHTFDAAGADGVVTATACATRCRSGGWGSWPGGGSLAATSTASSTTGARDRRAARVTALCGSRATCACTTTRRCGRRSTPATASCRCSASTTGSCAGATPPARAPSSCSSASRPRRRADRLVARGPARAPGARAAARWRARRAPRAALHAPTPGRSRGGGSSASCARWSVELHRPSRAARGRRPRRDPHHAGTPYTVFSPFHRGGSARRGERCSGGRGRSRRCPRA